MKRGKKPFIGATDSNNGITEFVSNTNDSEDSNILGVNYNGSVVENFYHPYKAIFSDDVKRLEFKEIEGNKYLYQFVKTVILKQKSKYQYGYKFNGSRMSKQKIMLPVTAKGNPDYNFMEQYMRYKEQEKITDFQNYITDRVKEIKNFKDVTPFAEKKWMEFRLQDIFNPTKGDQNKMSDLLKGSIPLISAKNGNNGLKDFVSGNSKKNYPKNTLTLNNDGDGGAGISYYQPFDYLLDSHVTSLESKYKLSKSSLLFISRCITKQRNKFGHGYALTNNRLKAFKIMLPINEDKTPDYEYMENYMKRLEYLNLTEYLEKKKIPI